MTETQYSNTIAETNPLIPYQADFDRSIQDAVGGPTAELRRTAMSRFLATGFPHRRDEEWRFTDIRPILGTPFTLAGFDQSQLPSSPLGATLFPELTGHRLVFVNGRFAPELSTIGDLPEGVVVGNIADTLQTHPDLTLGLLTQTPLWGVNAFSLLNEAFLEDGALIYLPRHAVVEAPILLVYISNPGEQTTVAHPRTLVSAGENSQVTLVESYLGTGGTSLTNALTEIYADQNAQIDHYKVTQEATDSYHIATTRIELQRSANFTSHSITLGGKIVRNDINAGLRGEGIECTLNGLYLGRDQQLIDNHTAIDHAMPHCNSHEVYKGILDDRARGVFNGKIYVRQDAQKTDAKQTNQTLLLSAEATINTKPQLEILADDVRCTHGATVGQLNADALFYLRSRGISKEQARAMLTFAFGNDIVNRIKVEPIRAELERALLSELKSS